MGKKANPAVIGGFVVGAVALAVAGVLIFGSGEFLKGRVSWVSYFPGSVDGLQVGAPVNFKGVKVGQVTDIKVTLDARDDTVRIPVSWDLEPDRIAFMGIPEAELAELQAKRAKTDRPLAQILIKRGLRAQLQLQSFVTGQKIIQLDFFPDTPINLVGGDGDVPEFPTTASSTEKLTKTIENLPIDELFTDARNTLQGIDRLVRNIDSQVLPPTHATLEKLQGTLSSVDATLGKAEGTLSSVDDMTAPGSPVRYELVNALKELAGAMRSMRVLADYLERHPEALVQGKSGSGGNRK
ncbi:MAG TPA: MlaD family protein [Nitrospiraceae bacterium]|nr:MlaD family protein [Nitrospiraceae bacterium]